MRCARLARGNLTSQIFEATVTQTVIATGSDGSTLQLHETGHLTRHADGTLSVNFDKWIVICG